MFRERLSNKDSNEIDPKEYSLGLLRAEVKIGHNEDLNWLFDEIEMLFPEEWGKKSPAVTRWTVSNLVRYFRRQMKSEEKQDQETGILGLRLLAARFPERNIAIQAD